ncbi:hypothetical protein, partial [Undibacterium sp.]|uniref:hypothetical protein n=1 Tax=Undibacterium sp. TaxID=1914977 RepID=UPI003751D425
SLKIASYFRLIHVKTASKSASTIISNPNGNSGFNKEEQLLYRGANWGALAVGVYFISQFFI